jgi:hypothetical protein
MLYGISNVGSFKGTVTDPLLEMVPGAIAGGVIAAVLRTIRWVVRAAWAGFSAPHW